MIAAEENRAMFDRIARRYDILNRIISLGQDIRWRERAIDALRVAPGGRYLDVGAGTGDLMSAIGKREETAVVLGLDPSAGMLAVGASKLENAGLESRACLHTGDASALPYFNEVFDGVVLGFCIRNVVDRQKALAEFLRVLRPGGRLVILELSVPAGGAARVGYSLFTSTFVPAAARLMSKRSAYEYLVKSVRAFPSRPAFEEMMRDAGFVHVRSETLTFGAVAVFQGEKRNV